ncbi:HD domain-containing phosphohydrolase [Clostridium sp.]|uniref:HD-GYP domain-containing protein n=1 Tax=Clostridium sp. TaxID=1506 RepID=UPI002FCB1E83
MKLSILSNKIIGKELAFPIYTDSGIMYLNSGIKLTEKYIKAIQNMQINLVYTNDGIDEIVLKEILDSKIKLRMIKDLKQEFTYIKATKKINDKIIKEIIEEIIEGIDMSENALFINSLGQTDDITSLCSHCIDVAILSIKIGVNYGYNYKKVFNLGVSALLHDIGKLFSQGKEHSLEGYNLLKKNYMFDTSSYIGVLLHHENVNGTGYPEGVKGNRIHEFAKIVSICDGYLNAINKEGLMLHQAMEKVQAETLRKYDEDIYKCFNKSIYLYPVGLDVKLNNGKIGTVILQNRNFPVRPIIMVEVDGKREYIDLNHKDNLTLFVEEVVL